MKYYIISTFEMDGHSSATSMICSNSIAKAQYLKALLYDEETNKYYPTRSTYKEEDGSETIYGDWDCGEWSINILPFKNYKDICNKERFGRTG